MGVARSNRNSPKDMITNQSIESEESPEVETAAESRLRKALQANHPELSTVWDAVRIVKSLQQQVLDFRGGISACRRFGQCSEDRRRGRLARTASRDNLSDGSENSQEE